jgi:cytochrome c-type biogenesis protein CcmH
VALVVVAAVVLAIGVGRPDHPTLDAQVQHIAGLVRCPICNGESAAASQTAPAVEIRSQIRQDLQAGQSQGQILQSLVQAYGPGILEKPQASGLGLVVWVLPVVGFVVGLAGLSFAFVRWRGGPGDAETDAVPAASVPGEAAGVPGSGGRHSERPSTAVEDPATLADPGLVSTGPARDSTGGSSAGRGPRGRRFEGLGGRRGSLLAVAGVAVVAAGVSWAVVESSGTRLPGQEITGQTSASAAQTIAAELQKANQYVSANDAPDAVKEFQKVLRSDPNDSQALTGEGWILAETGQPALLQRGLSMLAQAEKADPSYAPAHVYRGIALLSEDDYGDAVPELQWYLGHDPDPQLVPQVRKALTEAQTGLAATKP